MLAKINAAIDSDAERLTAIFKDIHQNLELGFGEKRTAAIVAKELEALGFEVTEGIAQTRVVGDRRKSDPLDVSQYTQED